MKKELSHLIAQRPSVTDLGIIFTLRELNTPLTSILLCLALLETDDQSDDQRKKCQQILKKNALNVRASLKDIYLCLSAQVGDE